MANREVAEEVAQETWLAVEMAWYRLKADPPTKSWIFSILTNRAKTQAVREKRSIPFSELSTSGFEDDPAVEPDRFKSGGGWLTPPGGCGYVGRSATLRR